jgi:hypothetical protein
MVDFGTDHAERPVSELVTRDAKNPIPLAESSRRSDSGRASLRHLAPEGFIFKPFAHFLSSYYLCCALVAEQLVAPADNRRVHCFHMRRMALRRDLDN